MLLTYLYLKQYYLILQIIWTYFFTKLNYHLKIIEVACI